MLTRATRTPDAEFKKPGRANPDPRPPTPLLWPHRTAPRRSTKLGHDAQEALQAAAGAETKRPLLDHLLFACLLEDSPHEAAEQAYTALEERYFDKNEVRVSTRRELGEVLKGLNDPEKAADRFKTTLQSVFETFFSFDIEAMKKQNLGVSVKQLEKLPGTTSFTVAYVVQNALGGHSIPVNKGLLTALRTLDVITDSEAAAGNVPGLERAVPKNKGVEVGSVLHQLGVEVGKNPYGQGARKRLLAIDPGCKDRLPKRPAPPKPEKPAPEAKKPKPAAKKPAEEQPAAKKAGR